MVNTDLLLSLAEIAGVFVGFGALITVRSGSAATAGELSSLRWVMSNAIWVIIVSLVPIFIAGFSVSGRELWLASSLLGLVTFAAMIVVNAVAPENLAERAAALAASPPARLWLMYGLTLWLPTGFLVLALGVVALGLLPDHEPALYVTAVGLGLFMAAIGLFVMVFWGRASLLASERDPGGGIDARSGDGRGQHGFEASAGPDQ